ncbi:MAG: hypothetical protein RL662_1118 [Bacteroidota bacterium]
MRKPSFIAILMMLVSLPSSVSAWGTIGHRVIAEVAQMNVKSSTSRKINVLLDNLPMAYWANWADFIKSDTTGEWDHTHTWHYVNAPSDLSKNDFIKHIKEVKQDNVYSEIPKLVQIIKDKVSSPEQKRTSLIFLIHLMGDAHQPMHVGRESDLGGNKVSLFWFNEPTNLHSVWDSKLIDYEKYSYSEYSTILDTLTKEHKKSFCTGSLEDWLYESHLLANKIYAGVKNEEKLMYAYPYKHKYTVEQQLQKGGLRLAAVLDAAFK